MPDDQWGLDHGSWSVLRHLYPNADVPAFQVSLDERRGFKEHLELGREIQSLRERGVLVPLEFDARAKQAVEAHDADSLAAPQKRGEALLETANPTVEHYLPLLYCMGCTDERDAVSYPYAGFDFGSIAMRMILFSDAKSAE